MTQIPWQEPDQLKTAWSALEALDRHNPVALAPVRKRAERIRALLARLDPEMERMCGATCPDCQDNCCARATIWYDFKDLLYLYFSGGARPERQMEKQAVPGAGRACSCLTRSGCRLARLDRPFVCTWYLCPGQKSLADGAGIDRALDEIKRLRQEMEECFCLV